MQIVKHVVVRKARMREDGLWGMQHGLHTMFDFCVGAPKLAYSQLLYSGLFSKL